jgi:hypothetical protein
VPGVQPGTGSKKGKRTVYGDGTRRRRGTGRDIGKQREAQYAHMDAKRAREKKGKDNVKAVTDLLEAHGIDPSMIGAVKAVRLNEWEVAAKTGPKNDKRLETKKLSAASIILEPSWATGPEWPVVQPGKPVSVRVRARQRGPALVGTWKTLALLPDVQIGYRRLTNGDLDPFHDERVLNIVFQILEAERPDLIAWTGDFLDMPEMSTKFRREPGFVQTAQASLDKGVEVLAVGDELSRDGQFMISGNHDIRLQNFTIDNALAAFGLRPGQSAPDTWPDLSIQRLLRMDELRCEYVGAYPAGAKYVNDNLAVIHGIKLGNARVTAAQQIVNEERVSVLHGHTHRRALAAKSRNSRGRAKYSVAYSPGCLCRTDGAVPSTSSQIDAFGHPVTIFEDWQNGMGIIRYQEDDGKFHIEDIPIFVEHRADTAWAMHRGTEFTA